MSGGGESRGGELTSVGREGHEGVEVVGEHIRVLGHEGENTPERRNVDVVVGVGGILGHGVNLEVELAVEELHFTERNLISRGGEDNKGGGGPNERTYHQSLNGGQSDGSGKDLDSGGNGNGGTLAEGENDGCGVVHTGGRTLVPPGAIGGAINGDGANNGESGGDGVLEGRGARVENKEVLSDVLVSLFVVNLVLGPQVTHTVVQGGVEEVSLG